MTWQAKLDEMYPYGASVTLVDDVPEGVGFDDSIHFLTPRFVVTHEAPIPTVQIMIYGMEKEITFTIDSLEEFSPGVHLVHTPDGEQDLLISTNLDQEVLNELRRARREQDEK